MISSLFGLARSASQSQDTTQLQRLPSPCEDKNDHESNSDGEGEDGYEVVDVEQEPTGARTAPKSLMDRLREARRKEQDKENKARGSGRRTVADVVRPGQLKLEADPAVRRQNKMRMAHAFSPRDQNLHALLCQIAYALGYSNPASVYNMYYFMNDHPKPIPNKDPRKEDEEWTEAVVMPHFGFVRYAVQRILTAIHVRLAPERLSHLVSLSLISSNSIARTQFASLVAYIHFSCSVNSSLKFASEDSLAVDQLEAERKLVSLMNRIVLGQLVPDSTAASNTDAMISQLDMSSAHTEYKVFTGHVATNSFLVMVEQASFAKFEDAPRTVKPTVSSVLSELVAGSLYASVLDAAQSAMKIRDPSVDIEAFIHHHIDTDPHRRVQLAELCATRHAMRTAMRRADARLLVKSRLISTETQLVAYFKRLKV